jgi:hypothetical protein
VRKRRAHLTQRLPIISTEAFDVGHTDYKLLDAILREHRAENLGAKEKRKRKKQKKKRIKHKFKGKTNRRSIDQANLDVGAVPLNHGLVVWRDTVERLGLQRRVVENANLIKERGGMVIAKKTW